MRNIFLMLLILSICGCTYHSQSDEPRASVTYKDTPYRSTESIGRLRSLALMPLEHKTYKGRYASLKDQEAALLRYQEKCAKFLTTNKGYEIVVIKDLDGKWESNDIESLENNNFKDLYQKWHEEKAGMHTAQIIQKIGYSLNVDGVLVIRVKERKPWDTFDALLNITFLNAPLYYNIGKSNIGAYIYETFSGRLVWQTEHSTFGEEGTPINTSLINLFDDMENAVPNQLTK